jgi:hypothetical protein
MFRRTVLASVVVLALSAGRAEAVSVRDVIELSKAGLSESVLLALIEVDRSVFTIDAATLKELKAGGVSDAVIIAMIHSGRPAPAAEAQLHPPAEPAPAQTPPQPQVVVIEHHDAAPAPQPVAYPVAVPVYVPVAAGAYGIGPGVERVTTTLSTDQGLVKARIPVPPNCVKAEPVYWGFGGKLRPGSWEPQPTVVCR